MDKHVLDRMNIGSEVQSDGSEAIFVKAVNSSGGTSTIADGADVTQGAIADAAVTGDSAGTISAKLRGLLKILSDVWSSADHWLKVQIAAALPAGEAHLGETGFAMNVTAPNETARTVGNTTAYTANQRVGAAIGVLTGMARVVGGSGEIVGLRISTDKKSITPRLRIHFFNASDATLAADNVNWKELYADASKRVGYWDMPALSTPIDTANSDCSRSQDFSLSLPYKCAAGQTSLWYAYETLDAFTPASGQKFSLVVKARLY